MCYSSLGSGGFCFRSKTTEESLSEEFQEKYQFELGKISEYLLELVNEYREKDSTFGRDGPRSRRAALSALGNILEEKDDRKH